MLENVSNAATESRHQAAPTMRQVVFRFLETAEQDDTASRVVDIALIVLILLSVIAVVIESIPAVERAYAPQLYWFEVFTIAVFSVEYALRLWSCWLSH